METPVSIAPSPESGGIRVTGTVKWFNQAKGYGFITSRDVVGNVVVGDVLLHRSVIEAYGDTPVLEGATVECDAIQKVRQLKTVFQAKKIVRVDNATSGNGVAVNGDAGSKREQRPRDILVQEPTGPVIEAVCKWFARPKGFGFLTSQDVAGDIFVHMDLMRRFGLRDLKQGQRVRVRAGETQKGWTATEIQLVPEAVPEPVPEAAIVPNRPFRLVTPAEFAA